MSLLLLISAIAGATRATTASAEQGDYQWNLRTAPIVWVNGPNARLDIGIAEQWTLGVAGNSLKRKIKAVGMNGKTGGMVLGYAGNRAFTTTWFIDLGVSYGDIRAESKNTSGHVFTRRLYNTSARLTSGYQWFWSRFNVSLDGGFEWNSAGDKYVMDDNGNRLEKIPLRNYGLVTEVWLGLAF